MAVTWVNIHNDYYEARAGVVTLAVVYRERSLFGKNKKSWILRSTVKHLGSAFYGDVFPTLDEAKAGAERLIKNINDALNAPE